MACFLRTAQLSWVLALAGCTDRNPEFVETTGGPATAGSESTTDPGGSSGPATTDEPGTASDPSVGSSGPMTSTSESGPTMTSDTDGLGDWDHFDRKRAITIHQGELQLSAPVEDIPVPVFMPWSYVSEKNNEPEKKYRFALVHGDETLERIPFEFESALVNEDRWVWLRMPELDPLGPPLTVLMLQGPNGPGPTPHMPGEAWDDEYRGVYHFTESKQADSTVHMRTIVQDQDAPWLPEGRIGSAVRDKETGAMVQGLPPSEVLGGGQGTLSLHLKVDPPNGNQYRTLLDGLDISGRRLLVQIDYGGWLVAQYNVDYYDLQAYAFGDYMVPADVWVHVVVVWDLDDPEAILRFYLDGEPYSGPTEPSIQPVPFTFNAAVTLAALDTGMDFYDNFQGALDETRLSTVARSPSYISAEYQLVVDNDMIVSVDPEELDFP